MTAAEAERSPSQRFDPVGRPGGRPTGRFRPLPPSRAYPPRSLGAIKHVVRTSLSIVLPALNEEAGIEAVMKRIPQTILRGQGLSCSINLLDGHSTDRTRTVA